MLLTLDIMDFGLIERAVIEFGSGFNVLTGETGAGKSIIIDALGVAAGQRASTEFIRSGCEKARVAAVFDVKDNQRLTARLKESGITPDESGVLIMSRDINRNGRNICRLNGEIVTLGIYRETGQALVELHGQHEQQTLLNVERHLELLDRYGGTKALSLRERVAELYKRWHRSRALLNELVNGAKDRARRLDMLRFQVEEIEAVSLVATEEEDLSQEHKRLSNAEKIQSLSEESYTILYAGNRHVVSVTELLGQSQRFLTELCELEPHLKPVLDTLDGVLYQIEDIARELANYRDKIEYNPERLQVVQDRIDLIRALKRKYGDTIEEILRYHDEAQRELEQLSGSEEHFESVSAQVLELNHEWREAARQLRDVREDIALKLEKAVASELAQLEMGKVDFKIAFLETAEPCATGTETVEFLISPNPGEPLRALAKIASGGELSRIMLAILGILAEVDDVSTLIFDEVDTGIGGRALQALAEKMDEMGRTRQMICVTHAPQLASCAATHFRISKEVCQGNTRTRVELLNNNQRVEELARMLGGKEVKGLIQEHARQLLFGRN